MMASPHAVDASPHLRVDVHNSLSYSAEQRRLLARARVHGPQEQSRADGQQDHLDEADPRVQRPREEADERERTRP